MFIDFYFYGISELNTICKLLDINEECSEIINSFHYLLIKIMESKNYNETKCGRVQDFWTKYMSDQNFPWTEKLNFLIQMAITIPLGNSECECGLSIMNYLKDKKRSNLKVLTLEDLMRVKINLDNNIIYFKNNIKNNKISDISIKRIDI